MMNNYKTIYGIKNNARLKLEKLLKTFSIALIIILFSATSYGQCVGTSSSVDASPPFNIPFNLFPGNVATPGNAIDGNAATAATLSLGITGAGLLGGPADLDVVFNKTINTGDSIVLFIGGGTNFLNAGVFSSLTATAYTGFSGTAIAGTAVGATSSTSTLNVLIIGGLNQARISFPVTAPARSVEIEFSAFLGAFSSALVYEVGVVPGPPTALTAACKSNVYLASKAAASSVTLQWFSSTDTTKSPVYTSSGTGYTSTYAMTTPGTYYVRQAPTGCGLYSKLTTVAAPTTITPLTSLDYGVTCNNNTATLTPTRTGGVGGFAYTWSLTSVSPANGIVLSSTSGSPITVTGSNNATGIIALTVTDSAGGCQLVRTKNVTKANGANCLTFGSSVLPAIGFSLSGSVTTGKPVLTWSALQEVNTSYYSIEASIDGTSFTALGKVTAAGNSSVPTSYTFTDVTSANAVVYYRVKLVDVDGGVTYSNVFSLRLSGSALAKIYPNPVTNFVNIETGAPGTYVAELFTVDGRKLTSTSLSTASGLVTFTINRSNVTSGVYLLKVTGKTTATSTYNTIMVK